MAKWIILPIKIYLLLVLWLLCKIPSHAQTYNKIRVGSRGMLAMWSHQALFYYFYNSKVLLFVSACVFFTTLRCPTLCLSGLFFLNENSSTQISFSLLACLGFIRTWLLLRLIIPLAPHIISSIYFLKPQITILQCNQQKVLIFTNYWTTIIEWFF